MRRYFLTKPTLFGSSCFHSIWWINSNIQTKNKSHTNSPQLNEKYCFLKLKLKYNIYNNTKFVIKLKGKNDDFKSCIFNI